MNRNPRYVEVKEQLVNQTLDRDLYTMQGMLILPRGTALNATHVERLQLLGYTHVWVGPNERSVPSLQLPSPVVETYQKTVASIGDLFVLAKSERKMNIDQLEEIAQELTRACACEHNFLNLITNLHSFDDYTFEHSVGVGLLSSQLGSWLGLPEASVRELMLAGTLHDIGKCMIDEKVLNKPGRLTVDEYALMKEHARLGYEILKRSGIPERIAVVALRHHERLDGRGYPYGLRFEDLDMYSKIVAVADVFNAMTSKRVYHDPSPYYQVLDELYQDAFGALDPTVVTTFVQRMTSFLVGNVVKLNDETQGKVVYLPPDRPTRPTVLTDEGQFLDLRERGDLYLIEVLAV